MSKKKEGQEVTVTYYVEGKEAWPAHAVADLMGMSVSWVSYLVRKGHLVPCSEFPGPGGKMRLFWPEDVLAYKEEREKERKAGVPKPSAAARSDLRKALEAFERELKSGGLKESSRGTYLKGAARFVDWFESIGKED